MNTSDRYNGWTNRETWLVNVWFNPESVEDVETAQQAIEEAHDEMPDFMRDFCNISAIDWDELKSHFEDDEEEDEEETVSDESRSYGRRFA